MGKGPRSSSRVGGAQVAIWEPFKKTQTPSISIKKTYYDEDTNDFIETTFYQPWEIMGLITILQESIESIKPDIATWEEIHGAKYGQPKKKKEKPKINPELDDDETAFDIDDGLDDDDDIFGFDDDDDII